jgi:hypothetical protein
MQLGFWNGKLRETATQTNQNMREYQDRWLVGTIAYREMDVNLGTKLALIF